MRKTKIVCTLGPANEDDHVLKSMMKAGMDVARFNFSHGSYESHKKRFEQVERLRKELNLPIATMMDTKGPEIRIGNFETPDPVLLNDGDTFTLTADDCVCTKERACITYKDLPTDVQPGITILIDDGTVELKVKNVVGNDIECEVIHGGKISNHKGVNVPGISLSMPYLSEADKQDLEFAASLDFDFISASFVRSGTDVDYLKRYTKSLGWNNVKIIAKIESEDGVKNIDEILQVADGIMVARGDMGVEIPFERIPYIQKELITKGFRAGKQVITATQMLESMINNARPTRAEITDVANAIYDGTSAIMLSGETAAGKFPIEAVRTMAQIATTTEEHIDYKNFLNARKIEYGGSVSDAIAHATVTTAHDLNAKAIITASETGGTARLISKFRPACPIVSCTTTDKVCRQMNLSWGVIPCVMEHKTNSDELFKGTVERAVDLGVCKEGDICVITAGMPLGCAGNTNMMKVEKVK